MSENGDIWTIGRILKWTEQYFGGKGVESPRLDAEVLLSHGNWPPIRNLSSSV